MSEINRRHFLRQTLAGTGAVLTSSMWGSSVFAENRSAVDRVQLGKTGITVSRLAMGTGVHGSARVSDHTKMGQPAFSHLMHHAFDEGINFLDMADLYGTHPYMRNALKEIPRDKYIMLSKIWLRDETWNDPSGGAVQEVDRFRKELGIDVLDVCLLHCMIDSNWPTQYERARDELSALKEKGVIRAVGCSCHDHGALKVAAENPWVDIIFARINNVGVKMDGTPEEISQTLKKARANGKAVVGMKIFGEGALITPEQKDSSIKYVLGNDLVDAMTIGMLKENEVDDSISRITRVLNS